MRNFIEENKISFDEGQRNSSITTVIGYALYLGMNKTKLRKELSNEIIKDAFIGKEINRLYDYCNNKNYGDWWSTTDAKLKYIF